MYLPLPISLSFLYICICIKVRRGDTGRAGGIKKESWGREIPTFCHMPSSPQSSATSHQLIPSSVKSILGPS